MQHPPRSRTKRTFSVMKLRIESTWSIIRCFIMLDRSSTFIATLSPVSVFCANLTLAKVPLPIVLPTSYLPTLRADAIDGQIGDCLCRRHSQMTKSLVFFSFQFSTTFISKGTFYTSPRFMRSYDRTLRCFSFLPRIPLTHQVKIDDWWVWLRD